LNHVRIVHRLKRWKSKRNCFHVIDDPRWTAAERRRSFCLAYAPVPGRHLCDAIVDWACNSDRDPTAAFLAATIVHKLLECGQEAAKFAPSVTAKVTQTFVCVGRDRKAKICAASVGDDPLAYHLTTESPGSGEFPAALSVGSEPKPTKNSSSTTNVWS
jgi:hypothetical protein